jgi:hypothetical protein
MLKKKVWAGRDLIKTVKILNENVEITNIKVYYHCHMIEAYLKIFWQLSLL